MLVVTDADNTLWDTDAVYAHAQLRLLDRLERAMGSRTSAPDRLAFLRSIDQQIAAARGGNLRYPPELLIHELCHAVAASGGARYRSPINISVQATAFLDELATATPELRPGVLVGMHRLRQLGATVVVATESDGKKCERLLRTHGLLESVAKTVAERKSPELFRAIWATYADNVDAFIIGDQIDRDIEFGKTAGYCTILFAGGFVPAWTLRNETTPHYTVTRFDEAVRIIEAATSKQVAAQ